MYAFSRQNFISIAWRRVGYMTSSQPIFAAYRSDIVHIRNRASAKTVLHGSRCLLMCEWNLLWKKLLYTPSAFLSKILAKLLDFLLHWPQITNKHKTFIFFYKKISAANIGSQRWKLNVRDTVHHMSNRSIANSKIHKQMIKMSTTQTFLSEVEKYFYVAYWQKTCLLNLPV